MNEEQDKACPSTGQNGTATITKPTEDQILDGKNRLRECLTTGSDEGITWVDPDAAYNILARDPVLIRMLALRQDQQAMERMKETSANLCLNTIIMTGKHEDGSLFILTGASFLDLLRRITEEQDPEVRDELIVILSEMLKYADAQPDLLENPVLAESLDGIKDLLGFLME